MLNISIKFPAGFKPGDKSGAMKAATKKAQLDLAVEINRNIRRNIVPGWGAGMSSRLNYFTGSLNRSWGTPPVVQGEIVGIGSTRPRQALKQEYGGEIRPVHAKALFIPLTIAAAKIGALKDKASQLGSGLIFGTDFAFAQRVNIKPKGYIARGIEKSKGAAPTILGNAIGSAIKAALGTK